MTTHSASGWLTELDGALWLVPRFTHEQSPSSLSEEDVRSFGVRLVGDAEEVSASRHKWIRVHGQWDGDTFTVMSFGESPFDDIFTARASVPPNETPRYERPRDDQVTRELEQGLIASGNIVSRRYLPATDSSWRVIVAAVDPEPIRAPLTQLHGDQLTLITSAWSQAQYEAATDDLTQHIRSWSLSAIVHGVNNEGVDRIIASPRALRAEIRSWHASQPNGLVELIPFITTVTA